MCGIAGYIGNVDEATRRLAVRAMTDAIERRGPDGAGLESWPDATLGHRRLAIIDLSEAGHQPMLTDDRAVYRNVFKVPAAGIVEWADGHVTTRCYWQPPEVNPSLRISFDEAVEETERIFVESVRLRLHADVPVGALLSGGVDSSL